MKKYLAVYTKVGEVVSTTFYARDDKAAKTACQEDGDTWRKDPENSIEFDNGPDSTLDDIECAVAETRLWNSRPIHRVGEWLIFARM